MEIRQYGICIGIRQWRENDRMLSLFCEDGNVYDVLARGAYKPKYKLKFAAQLFSTCEYLLCPSKAGYYILGGASFGELSFLGVASDPDAYAAACLVCEIAQKCVRGESKFMYAQTLAALGELSAGCSRPDSVCLKMLLSALDESGFGKTRTGALAAVCDTVLRAEAGNVSSLDIEKAAVKKLLLSEGARFGDIFGKLNSLEMAAGAG